MVTAKKKAPGRPFVKDDPRINRRGRPKAILTQALMAMMGDGDADAIIKRVVALAKSGDLQAVQMLWDRIEGKPVARNEDGKPGDFDSDLEPEEISDLRSALKVVRGRNDG